MTAAERLQPRQFVQRVLPSDRVARGEDIEPEAFGMRRWGDEEHPTDSESFKELGSRRINLNTAKFVSAEPKIHGVVVQDYLDNPRKKSPDGDVAVIHHEGELWIHDGHHRIPAALLRGQKTMDVMYSSTNPAEKKR